MSPGLFRFAWIILAHVGVAGFIAFWVSSLWHTLGSLGSVRVHSATHRGRWIHSGSFRFTHLRLGVAGFIWVRLGSLGRSSRSLGSFGFNSACVGVTEFIRVRLCSLWRAYIGVRVPVGKLGRVC